ncbi:hypothetical protein CK203_025269 [Vitis vinifera]|uniref:ATP-dependent Clp protease proteolytic subunit n=1 Tax=Vitis vinifera TaxID=29760 RepID=A0A438JEX5_VITVI|nr:hypothetical protein CK203_025269 [Vitis vinifera]
MERSLTLTYAASASRPLCFNRSPSSSSLWLPSTSRSSRKGRAVSMVKASSASRPTLASNWDLSSLQSASAPLGCPDSKILTPLTCSYASESCSWALSLKLELLKADFLCSLFLLSIKFHLVISQLLFLDAEDQEKDIKLFINSPGGSVTAELILKIVLHAHFKACEVPLRHDITRVWCRCLKPFSCTISVEVLAFPITVAQKSALSKLNKMIIKGIERLDLRMKDLFLKSLFAWYMVWQEDAEISLLNFIRGSSL